MDFGADVKFIRQISSLQEDFNFIGVGLGGQIQSLDTLPKTNCVPPTSMVTPPLFQTGKFSHSSSAYSSVFSNFNYDKTGKAFPNGTR